MAFFCSKLPLMVKFFTQVCPASPMVNQTGSFIKQSPGCLTIVKGQLVPVRYFAEKKGDDDKAEEEAAPSKKAEGPPAIRMPGAVTPETKNEEAYFALKTKHDLEELKKTKPPASPEEKP